MLHSLSLASSVHSAVADACGAGSLHALLMLGWLLDWGLLLGCRGLMSGGTSWQLQDPALRYWGLVMFDREALGLESARLASPILELMGFSDAGTSCWQLGLWCRLLWGRPALVDIDWC